MIMPAQNSIPSVDQDLSDASPHPVGHAGPHAEVPAQDASQDSQSVGTKRLKPGERRIQILQTLAGMLEQPTQERVTTATLAAKLALSEAALYRHFASKAQMFEGLIEFIEESIYHLIGQISEREGSAEGKQQKIVTVVLQFAQKNPGMARVMVGDALLTENERLMSRMNHFFDRIESSLRQVLREAAVVKSSPTPTLEANQRAALLVCFLQGRLQRFVRSGFKKSALEHLEANLSVLVGAKA
jgi:TetR/AcrR family transcriptional regulator